MEKQSVEVIKELFLSLLTVIAIALIVVILLYDKTAISKVISQSDEYIMSSEMKTELNETKGSTAEEVIINYYIDAIDLKNYEKNKEYVKGKSDPFAVGSYIDDSTDPDSNNTNSSNNNSTGFYEDEGTK